MSQYYLKPQRNIIQAMELRYSHVIRRNVSSEYMKCVRKFCRDTAPADNIRE
jgi:hypothetical protein